MSAHPVVEEEANVANVRLARIITYSLKEKELQLIEENLEFDSGENRWIAAYPWIKDSADLPDNRGVALGMSASTEKRLARNPDHTKVYQEQIQDMVDRNVARKLTREELEICKGPIHYILHHKVVRPCRFKVYSSEDRRPRQS